MLFVVSIFVHFATLQPFVKVLCSTTDADYQNLVGAQLRMHGTNPSSCIEALKGLSIQHV